MNEKTEELKQRTKAFALAVLRFRRTLPATDEARDIGRQLTRAATGVGSNYRAVCRARSDPEFVARLGVALEEADESAFWLEVITEDRISTTPDAFALLDEANQLTAILASSAITASRRIKPRF
jgi:four helix bundle protein